MTQQPSQADSLSWIQAIKVYQQKPVLMMLFLGFAAGLPYLLVFSTLTAWLHDEDVSRSTIGFFAWVGICYSIKVFWAPVVDRLKLPFLNTLLGQRRSWILFGQSGIAVCLLGMSCLSPGENLWLLAVLAVSVAFFSATQDVALDAFRIESAVAEYQGAMSASYILGYRLALLMAGAGALFFAQWFSWPISYQIMSALMLLGMMTVLLSPEPVRQQPSEPDVDVIHALLGSKLNAQQMPAWKQRLLLAVVCPFVDFFKRYGRFAWILLLLISVFRLSDIAMGIMANSFYLDLGFSKAEIASVAKVFGFAMTILGSALCGIWVVKWGLYRPLLLGAVLVAATNVLFASLALSSQPDLIGLAVVISADNLSGGIAATAFVAYLSSLTSRSYTATQYALFSSLMTLPGKLISGFSGVVVDAIGYPGFFVAVAMLGLPAIFLVVYIRRNVQQISCPD